MKRILKGFSMVEMMLLLLVTSLMLASAVTIVTKKHVKVPKITTHGSYMCYMKNGRLHEEQYVGPGTNKKILDRDVAQCSFTPPERASYLHVQAIGGGGGGGDSGYTGGNLQVFESATEVISPFGITANLLQLKGIPEAELKELGGNLYAYAMAEGSGKGGDVWYIREDCKNTCLQYRYWDYRGTQEVDCSCSQRSQNYTVYHYNYDLWDNCDNTCNVSCTHTCYDTCWKTCYDTCYRSEKQNCDYRRGDCYSCYTWVGGSCKDNAGYNTVSVPYDCRPYSCSYDCNPYRCHSYDTVTSASQCGTHVCNATSGSCSTSTVPTSSFSDTYSNLTVHADDKYTEDWNSNPQHMYESTPATGTTDMRTRDVNRDEQTPKFVCNYGNPAKFTGVSDGIFGSFMEGEVPLECTSGAIIPAFGDEIFPLGGGNTVITRIAQKSSTDVYGGEGIKYDRSEEDNNTYGQRCVNETPNGSCRKYTDKLNVPGVSKSLVTGYNVSYSSYGSGWCPSRSSYDSGYVSLSHTTTSSTSVHGNDSDYCSCPKVNSKGEECVLSKNLCSYIPDKVAGGAAGTGSNCRTANMAAALGLNYIGNSSVIPGIRGSDKNLTGAGYKAIYKEPEWKGQPSGYAENGTDAQGSSTVTMTRPGGTNSCTANALAPTAGKGARKLSTGASTPTAGPAPTRPAGTTVLNNATNGAGCGSQHVGYCLVRKAGGTDENGKYTYKYTWNTNYLQFGEGGKAGEYRAMVIRSFGNRQLPITLGQGGAGGADATGDAGADGQPTIVGDIIRADGGVGGPGGQLTPVEQLPTWYAGGDFVKGWNGTQGESANVSNFKSNILNLVLPVDNTILGQWLAASGAGGDGGGSVNDCWASEWVRWFEGTKIKTSIEEEDVACRPHPPGASYWSATPNATSGSPGAVLIRW